MCTYREFLCCYLKYVRYTVKSILTNKCFDVKNIFGQLGREGKHYAASLEDTKSQLEHLETATFSKKGFENGKQHSNGFNNS